MRASWDLTCLPGCPSAGAPRRLRAHSTCMGEFRRRVTSAAVSRPVFSRTHCLRWPPVTISRGAWSTLFVLSTLASYFKSGDIIFFDNFICSMDEFRAFEDFVKAFRVKYEVLGGVQEYIRKALT